jgi:hypothetical protein
VADESQLIRNKWGESKVDVVVCFARNSNFGYLFAPFKGATELLNAKTHLRFNQNKNSFLKAFHKL